MAKSRIRKFRESFLYAGRGLRLCITGERNFRVHMTAAFYVTAAAVMGHVTSTEAAVLCLCFGLTMGAELMNTAVERLCDKTARGYDRMVRDAKDIAAESVCAARRSTGYPEWATSAARSCCATSAAWRISAMLRRMSLPESSRGTRPRKSTISSIRKAESLAAVRRRGIVGARRQGQKGKRAPYGSLSPS